MSSSAFSSRLDLKKALISGDGAAAASDAPSDYSSYFEDGVYTPDRLPSRPSNGASDGAVVAVSINEAAADKAVLQHTRPNLPILTGLRGVLAAWIICHNMVGIFEPNKPPELLASWPLLSGSVAVSMFFCLSGFVLTYSYGDHAFDSWPCYWSFLGRRYGRMMPMYLLAVVMGLGFELQDIREYGYHMWTALHWLAVLTGTQTWWPWPLYPYSRYPDFLRGLGMFNGSVWSIQTELFFYCCFPLLLRVLRWSLGGLKGVAAIGARDEQLNGRLKRLLCWFALLTATSLCNTPVAWHTDTFWIFVYVNPVFRISEFALGIVTCHIFMLLVQARREGTEPHVGLDGGGRLVDMACNCAPLYSRWSLDAVCLLTGAALVASGLLAEHEGLAGHILQQNPGTLASVLCLILLLATFTYSPYANADKSHPGRRGVVSWILTQPIVHQMGVLSFAFYTFHLVPYYYLTSIDQPPIQSIAVEFCAAMGLACMAHVYVEKPAYVWVARRLPKCGCAAQTGQ